MLLGIVEVLLGIDEDKTVKPRRKSRSSFMLHDLQETLNKGRRTGMKGDQSCVCICVGRVQGCVCVYI